MKLYISYLKYLRGIKIILYLRKPDALIQEKLKW